MNKVLLITQSLVLLAMPLPLCAYAVDYLEHQDLMANFEIFARAINTLLFAAVGTHQKFPTNIGDIHATRVTKQGIDRNEVIHLWFESYDIPFISPVTQKFHYRSAIIVLSFKKHNPATKKHLETITQMMLLNEPGAIIFYDVDHLEDCAGIVGQTTT